MKFFVTLLFVSFTLFVQAQDSGFFIGKWIVIDVLLSKDASADDKKALEMMKPYLLKTRFQFDKGNRGICNMTLPTIVQGIKPSSDVYWIYDPTNRNLIIKEWKLRKRVTAEYTVKIEDDDVYFVLTDGPLILKVKKQKVYK